MVPRIANLLMLTLVSGAAQAASVRRAGEDAYFRCSFSGKTAVLCGSMDNDSGVKRLQYRIHDGGRVEMQYPGSPRPPESRFLQSSLLLAHGGEIRVSFRVGEYKYVLYETWDTRSPSHGGIYVLRKDTLVRQYQCDDDIDPKASLLESRIKERLQQEEYIDFDASRNAR